MGNHKSNMMCLKFGKEPCGWTGGEQGQKQEHWSGADFRIQTRDDGGGIRSSGHAWCVQLEFHVSSKYSKTLCHVPGGCGGQPSDSLSPISVNNGNSMDGGLARSQVCCKCWKGILSVHVGGSPSRAQLPLSSTFKGEKVKHGDG